MKRLWLAVLIVASLLGSRPAAQSGYELFQQALSKEQAEGKLQEAIVLYQRVVKNFAADHALAAKALLRLGECYQKIGGGQAERVYEQLLNEFSDQRDAAAEARARLAALQFTASHKEQPAREVWTGAINQLRGVVPSRDGRYLSFTDMETGDVALRDLSRGTNRRLTHTGGWASGDYADGPVMSPDGTHVAYTWYVDKEDKIELRVAAIAGAEHLRPRAFLQTRQNEGLYGFAWMPGGRQLVGIRLLPDRTNQIGTLTLDDGSFRTIKSLEWRRPNLVSLSPDGRYIAYDVPAGEAGSPRDILVLATDGSRETAVVQNPANDSFPVWAPDGSSLLFLSDRTGRNSLWTVPMEGGRATGPAVPVRTDVGPIRLLGVTKNGTLYYFEPLPPNRNLYVAALDAAAGAKPPVPLTERVAANNFGPAWSRDGEFLAYYSFRDVSADMSSGLLVIRSAKNGEERTVPLPTRVISRFGAGPKWFPGNRAVLVEVGDAQGAGFGFYRLTVDTGNIELLTHVPRVVSSYDLSPDGRTIFYVVGTSDGGQELIRFDMDGRRETALRKSAFAAVSNAPGWAVVSVAVSPDGAQLATMLIGGIVEVLPANGGETREVFRPATRELGTGLLRQSLAWTPDQRFLLFARGDGTIWKAPALGGAAEQVGLSGGAWPSPAVHPDGTRIVFSRAGGAVTSKVWALEHFLPAQNIRKQTAKK